MVPATVTPRLHPQLLRELPRFFSGPVTLLRELLQNAHRAGASRVTVTTTPQGFTLLDDGPGVEDPQILLDAGRSGWGEDVTEPAGVGVFSLLDPAAVTRVTFASHRWSLDLTPRDLEQAAPLRVDAAPWQAGLRIEVTLSIPIALADVLREARGRLALIVTLNGEEIPVLERLWGAVEALTFPGGSLRYGATRASHGQHVVIWEGQPLEVPIRVLSRGASPLGLSLLAPSGCLFTHGLEITPERGTLARPVLPERRAMRDDAALEALLSAALTALEAAVRTRVAALEWPEEFVEQHPALKQLALLPDAARDLLLNEAGISVVCDTQYPLCTVHCSEHFYDETRPQTTRFTRNVIAVSDEAAAATVNLLRTLGLFGHWAEVRPGGVPLEFEGVMQRGVLALAREIRLGPHRVPFALRPDEDPAGAAILTLAGDPGAALSTLEAHRLDLGGFFILHGQHHAFQAALEWDGDTLHPSAGAETLLEHFHATLADAAQRAVYLQGLDQRRAAGWVRGVLSLEHLGGEAGARLAALRGGLEALLGSLERLEAPGVSGS